MLELLQKKRSFHSENATVRIWREDKDNERLERSEEETISGDAKNRNDDTLIFW